MNETHRRSDPEPDHGREVVVANAVDDGDAVFDQMAADLVLEGGADIRKDADEAHGRPGRPFGGDVEGEEATERGHEPGQTEAVDKERHGHEERFAGRAEEDHQKTDDLHGREDHIGRWPASVEDLVRGKAEGQCAEDPGDGVDRDDAARLHQRVALGLLQVEHAPAVDGVAGDIDRRARQRQHPDRGDLEDRPLDGPGALFLVLAAFIRTDVVVLPVGDPRQTEGLRSILHQQIEHPRRPRCTAHPGPRNRPAIPTGSRDRRRRQR